MDWMGRWMGDTYIQRKGMLTRLHKPLLRCCLCALNNGDVCRGKMPRKGSEAGVWMYLRTFTVGDGRRWVLEESKQTLPASR